MFSLCLLNLQIETNAGNRLKQDRIEGRQGALNNAQQPFAV